MAYKNKEDQAKNAKAHYEKNKAEIKKRAQIYKKKQRVFLRNWVTEYLETHPCVDCGFSDTRALDFDHVRGTKLNNICSMVNRANSLENLKKEIDKCEVRCSNCHRIQTHLRRI